MRHLTVTEFGHFLGCKGGSLLVKNNKDVLLETPLSRLRTISIAKEGVSFSSNLVLACANRGIRLFVLDWRGISVAAITGQHQHALAQLRKSQFKHIEHKASHLTASNMIYGKLRNQRATLLYFSKYQKQQNTAASKKLVEAADRIVGITNKLRQIDWTERDGWREEIMGYEGAAANQYWLALSQSGLVPESFKQREGRGALEVTNQLLNYGYTLLSSYIWSALDNAGFEIYAGILHQQRSGKPALVLDMMEEYRPWVVDRNVIKLRKQLGASESLNTQLKKKLSSAIHNTMANRYPYHGKRLKLETILQRQAYRLGATVVDGKVYKPYRFKW